MPGRAGPGLPAPPAAPRPRWAGMAPHHRSRGLGQLQAAASPSCAVNPHCHAPCLAGAAGMCSRRGGQQELHPHPWGPGKASGHPRGDTGQCHIPAAPWSSRVVAWSCGALLCPGALLCRSARHAPVLAMPRCSPCCSASLCRGAHRTTVPHSSAGQAVMSRACGCLRSQRGGFDGDGLCCCFGSSVQSSRGLQWTCRHSGSAGAPGAPGQAPEFGKGPCRPPRWLGTL